MRIHRDHWPVILLLGGYLFLGLTFLIVAMSDANALCTADEKGNAALCVRNWINAAGNTLAVIGAIAAATFAYRQYREARRQTAIARLPMAEARLLTTRQMADSLMGVAIALGSMRDGIDVILEEMTSNDPTLERIVDAAKQYSLMERSISPVIESFQKSFSETVLDSALEAAVRPGWFDLNVSLLEVEPLRSLTESVTEINSHKEEQINYKRLHDLLANPALLAKARTALHHGVQTSRNMSKNASVLIPSFKAARDSLHRTIGHL